MQTPGLRPKLTIPKSKSEWIWDCFGFLCYFVSIIFLLSVWGKLPEEVPAHFNAAGEVDRWGSKAELFILPAIGLLMVIIMTALEKHPEIHNYPKRFKESNAEQFYFQSRKIVNQLKNIILIVFSIIMIESISIALGWGGRIGIWLLPLTILGTLLPLVIGILKIIRIK